MNKMTYTAIVCIVFLALVAVVPVNAQCPGSQQNPYQPCDCAEDDCCTVYISGNAGTGQTEKLMPCYNKVFPWIPCFDNAVYEVDVQWCDVAKINCLEIEEDCTECPWSKGYYSNPQFQSGCSSGSCTHDEPDSTGTVGDKCVYEP